MSARARWAADGLLFFITAVWGFTFVTVQDALVHADALTFLALRFSVGAVVAALLANRQLADVRVWKRGSVLGVLLFVGYWLQTEGLRHTTPSRSAFITGLCVLLVPFVSIAVMKRLPGWSALGGGVLAAIGLYLLTGAEEEGGGIGLGEWLTLGCACAYAVHIALTERLSRDVAPLALVAVQLSVTAALSTLAMLLNDTRRLDAVPALWGAVAATGIVASALAISIQTWAQAKTTAVRAALIFALEPVFAVAYSVSLGKEQVTTLGLLGGGLIIAGVLVGEFLAPRPKDA